MWHYLLRRLLLLPVTLFCILLVNFIIINLAPGEPSAASNISETGEASRSADKEFSLKNEDPYSLFRARYGLTLPILWNLWPSISLQTIWKELDELAVFQRNSSSSSLSFKQYTELKTKIGDQARFVMPRLLSIIEDRAADPLVRTLAMQAFIRGGTRQAFLGANLSEEERGWNRRIAQDNRFLRSLAVTPDSPQWEEKVTLLQRWYEENESRYHFNPDFNEKIIIFFTETRFFRYFSKMVTLDFGTLRNDDQKSVIREVVKRFKYSLTLSVVPLVITFFLCQFFGLIMALRHNTWPDLGLNVSFLILFAIPVFVVAPFLIEKIALHHFFPFTNYPIPMSGFSSPDDVYIQETSVQRFLDISAHLFLPFVALLYGSLAAQSRLSRTAFLEVMRQDYVRTAFAKGVPPSSIYIRHVGRNAAITIVTSVAGSLGVILAGSLIVETLFQINGFGRFFYEAILNRDYNVMMFSALSGAVLTLLGYLVADIAYSALDPRVTFD